MILHLLGEAMPNLVNESGTPTAIGIWLLMAIMSAGGALWIYNMILGSQLKRKQLAAPENPAINPQPFIVAMEKEFVARAEYERRHSDVENQVKEARTYAHTEIHAIRGILQNQQLSMEVRNERLSSLEADSKTHTRQLTGLDAKVDKIIDELGIQKGRTTK